MTTSSSVNKFRYEGNGVTDTFAFTGRIFSTSDLVVEIILRADDSLVETLDLGSDYTVTINSSESASVVVDGGKIPSSLQDIQIRRALAKTQTLDLPTGTRFPAVSVENALDKVTALTQDLSEILDRTITLSVTSSGTAPTVGSLTTDEAVVYDGTSLITTGITTTDIQNAATNATAAAASAVAAAASADAAAAAVGGLYVSANDTTAGNLEAKLLVGSGLALSTQNDGGNETRTIDIDRTVNAIGSIGGGTQDIDLDSGRTVTGTVDTSTTTFTFSNPDTLDAFDLYLTNGGSQTVNWPASVDWAGGTAPTLTSSGVDHLVFTTPNGGTTWYGYVAGLDMS